MVPLEHAADVDLVAVGATTARSTRIWLRARRPGPHLLRLSSGGWSRERSFEVPADREGTTSVAWPGDFPGEAPLEPLTRYTFRVESARGDPVGEGSLETAPVSADDAPDGFTIGLVSCHQPFDGAGEVRPAAARMLEVLERTLVERRTRRLLEIGDQMYADLPAGLSLHDDGYFARVAPPGRRRLLDCTADEVRRLYAARWRAFLSTPALARVHAALPCYPMHDDHELVDNFGSLPEHTLAEWAPLRVGALDASFDHQALRMTARAGRRPSSACFSFRYGPVAGFVLDLRSQRRATRRRVTIVDPPQIEALEAFLAGARDAAVVIVGLSVPLVHVPDWLASLGSKLGAGDAADRWSFPPASRSRERLMAALHRHHVRFPRQLLLLASGDVHIGAVSELRFAGSDAKVLQLTSSPITNDEGELIQAAAALAPGMIHRVDGGPGAPDAEVRILEGAGERDRNPYAALNAGFVELARAGSGWLVRLHLVGDEGCSVLSTRELGPYHAPGHRAGERAGPPMHG